jgi:hypothetical protein
MAYVKSKLVAQMSCTMVLCVTVFCEINTRQCTLILYLVYVLHWLDDGCLTAETCSPHVIDI